MKIYSNKKRPVKASNDGRKWVNTELTQDEYAKFRNFLKKKGYKYETSGAGDMVHIEAYLNEAEIKEADNFLDTLDNVNGACGKKSVKASNEGRSDLIYVIMVNGDPVAKGSYDAMTKKSYSYNYPVKMLKFPKVKLNSLMKMAKDAHRPDPLKFAVNRFINDYPEDYRSINSSCDKDSIKANWLTSGKKSDDGTFSYTISEGKLCFGVPGAYFIWRGDMADPWVEYDGKVYYYSDVEEMIYGEYEAWCEYESGEIPTDEGFDDYLKNYVTEDDFINAVYDLAPFAEVVETSGNYHWAKEIGVNASTKCRRNTTAVKASEVDELEDDPFINALWKACDDVPQLVEINYEATEGIIFIFNHTTDDYDGREALLINSLEAAGYDAEYLANNGSNVIVLDVKEKGINASVTSRKAVKASELTDVNGYAVQIHDMHDAMYDLLLFGNREDAEWASEQLEIISNCMDNGELDDYEYSDMLSDVFNMSDDYIEEINFRTEIDRNNIWTALDDSKWQIVNPVSVSLWL